MSTGIGTASRATPPGRGWRAGSRRSGLVGGGGSRTVGLLGAVALLAVVCLLSLRIGSVEMSTATAVRAFTVFDGSNEHLIVRTLRVPRTLIGLGVGAVLAVAGAIMQAVTRNPLARLLKPRHGGVYLDGQAIARLPTRQVAVRLRLLPQAPEGLTVEDLIGRGRFPYQHWFQQWTADDAAAVEQALTLTGTQDLRHRPVDQLSGGQRQRARLAMALAQATPILLLDEPTTFLDLAHQVDILDLLADLNHTQHRTIVMVLHDLNEACRYAHHIVAMHQGRIHTQGAPADVVTAGVVRAVFGLDVTIIDDPITATPLCMPISRRNRQNTPDPQDRSTRRLSSTQAR